MPVPQIVCYAVLLSSDAWNVQMMVQTVHYAILQEIGSLLMDPVNAIMATFSILQPINVSSVIL